MGYFHFFLFFFIYFSPSTRVHVVPFTGGLLLLLKATGAAREPTPRPFTTVGEPIPSTGRHWELNPVPLDPQTNALPIELTGRLIFCHFLPLFAGLNRLKPASGKKHFLPAEMPTLALRRRWNCQFTRHLDEFAGHSLAMTIQAYSCVHCCIHSIPSFKYHNLPFSTVIILGIPLFHSFSRSSAVQFPYARMQLQCCTNGRPEVYL